MTTENLVMLFKWYDKYEMWPLRCHLESFIRSTQKCSKDVLIVAFRMGMMDMVDRILEALLDKGMRDWRECYMYQGLTEKILEYVMKNRKLDRCSNTGAFLVSGPRDWSKCYMYQGLTKKILENVMPNRQLDRSLDSGSCFS